MSATLAIKALESAIEVLDLQLDQNTRDIQLIDDTLSYNLVTRESTKQIELLKKSTILIKTKHLKKTRRNLVYLKNQYIANITTWGEQNEKN